MKKTKQFVISGLFLSSIAFSAFGGYKDLSDGTRVTWSDTTKPVQYNSYRVEIRLDKTSQQNVWGEVTLYGGGKTYRGTSLFIKAGERSGYVDFENLPDGKTYEIQVKINND